MCTCDIVDNNTDFFLRYANWITYHWTSLNWRVWGGWAWWAGWWPRWWAPSTRRGRYRSRGSGSSWWRQAGGRVVRRYMTGPGRRTRARSGYHPSRAPPWAPRRRPEEGKDTWLVTGHFDIISMTSRYLSIIIIIVIFYIMYITGRPGETLMWLLFKRGKKRHLITCIFRYN